MYNYSGDCVVMAGEGCCQGTQRTQVDGCSIVYGLSHAASCAPCVMTVFGSRHHPYIHPYSLDISVTWTCLFVVVAATLLAHYNLL